MSWAFALLSEACLCLLCYIKCLIKIYVHKYYYSIKSIKLIKNKTNNTVKSPVLSNCRLLSFFPCIVCKIKFISILVHFARYPLESININMYLFNNWIIKKTTQKTTTVHKIECMKFHKRSKRLLFACMTNEWLLDDDKYCEMLLNNATNEINERILHHMWKNAS